MHNFKKLILKILTNITPGAIIPQGSYWSPKWWVLLKILCFIKIKDALKIWGKIFKWFCSVKWKSPKQVNILGSIYCHYSVLNFLYHVHGNRNHRCSESLEWEKSSIKVTKFLLLPFAEVTKTEDVFVKYSSLCL